MNGGKKFEPGRYKREKPLSQAKPSIPMKGGTQHDAKITQHQKNTRKLVVRTPPIMSAEKKKKALLR